MGERMWTYFGWKIMGEKNAPSTSHPKSWTIKPPKTEGLVHTRHQTLSPSDASKPRYTWERRTLTSKNHWGPPCNAHSLCKKCRWIDVFVKPTTADPGWGQGGPESRAAMIVFKCLLKFCLSSSALLLALKPTCVALPALHQRLKGRGSTMFEK